MKKDSRDLKSLLVETEGLSTVEYVILLILVVVLSVGLWKAFGGAVRGRIGEATTGPNGIQNLNNP